nr:MAG TPA: hypothetical protein [Caudoviricetes sp.]
MCYNSSMHYLHREISYAVLDEDFYKINLLIAV